MNTSPGDTSSPDSAFGAWQAHIDAAVARNDLRLHVGCGRTRLDGWINIDGHPHPDTMQMKLPQGLSAFADASACYIYSSHFLEHLDYPGDASAMIAECHRILAPGGSLRIVVPGIEKIIRAYVDKDSGFFDIQADLHPAWCNTPLEHLMYALQQDGEHKYGYDFETLSQLLSRAGFEAITDSDYNQSAIDALRVDYRGLRDNHGRTLSLYVDASKALE